MAGWWVAEAGEVGLPPASLLFPAASAGLETVGTSGCKLFITVDFRENQYGTCTNRK